MSNWGNHVVRSLLALLLLYATADRAHAQVVLGNISCTNTGQHGCRPDQPQDTLTRERISIWLHENYQAQIHQGDTVVVSSTINGVIYAGAWSWVGISTVFSFVTGGVVGSSGGSGGGQGGGGGTGGGSGAFGPSGVYTWSEDAFVGGTPCSQHPACQPQ